MFEPVNLQIGSWFTAYGADTRLGWHSTTDRSLKLLRYSLYPGMLWEQNEPLNSVARGVADVVPLLGANRAQRF